MWTWPKPGKHDAGEQIHEINAFADHLASAAGPQHGQHSAAIIVCQPFLRDCKDVTVAMRQAPRGQCMTATEAAELKIPVIDVSSFASDCGGGAPADAAARAICAESLNRRVIG